MTYICFAATKLSYRYFSFFLHRLNWRSESLSQVWGPLQLCLWTASLWPNQSLKRTGRKHERDLLIPVSLTCSHLKPRTAQPKPGSNQRRLRWQTHKLVPIHEQSETSMVCIFVFDLKAGRSNMSKGSLLCLQVTESYWTICLAFNMDYNQVTTNLQTVLVVVTSCGHSVCSVNHGKLFSKRRPAVFDSPVCL